VLRYNTHQESDTAYLIMCIGKNVTGLTFSFFDSNCESACPYTIHSVFVFMYVIFHLILRFLSYIFERDSDIRMDLSVILI